MRFQQVKALFGTVTERLKLLTRRNAVVSKPVSVGDRHIITLCELRLGFGAGGGQGEGDDGSASVGKGTGGAAGGMARATPVAVLVIDNGKARLETLNQ
ncbi:MAG: hypothetical protein EP329_14005 [Deltaproteobacteria bacterium]|nr:MAG: hypothetical protein EP329_14005 [Deltaproteobacteria bacterium]